MKRLRFAVIGTGFWANYQIPAWMELDGVELVAVYNRTRNKAEAIARKFNIPAVYDDVSQLLENERLDFVDIITDVDTHLPFTKLAAEKGINAGQIKSIIHPALADHVVREAVRFKDELERAV